MRRLKLTLLFGAKWLGLYWVFRQLNQHSLRILCYHGFSFLDEHEFRPKLFMKPDDFDRRMSWLKQHKYRVISLDNAVALLRRGSLPSNTVVITMDDGLVGVWQKATPILKKYGYPATVYVTSYYVEKQQPLFNIAVQYLFWLSGKQQVDIPEGRYDWVGMCILLREMPPADRPAAIAQLGRALNVDISRFMNTRVFHLMSSAELAELEQNGIAIQLHTHRHRWSLDDWKANARELEENRSVLSHIVKQPLVHFCYPAGQFAPDQFERLASIGIESATTLEPGLNRFGSNPFGLRRVIDGSNVTTIEFEAELSGFMDALRSVSKTLQMTVRKLPADAASPNGRSATGATDLAA